MSVEIPPEGPQNTWLMRKLFLLYLLFLTACTSDETPAPEAADFATWTNPITSAVVPLPEEWRNSPDTASKGETVVGYFTPRYAWMMGEYGHISLHHEDLSGAPPTLENYSQRMADYLRLQAESITQKVLTKKDGLEKAHFEVETVYKRRRKVLRCLFWTYGDGHFWYAITELLAQDRAFIARAMPVVDLLVAGTAPKPAP